MSDKQKKQEEMERELDEAIEGMEDACDNANGNCAKKVRSRTIRVKMSLMAES